MQEPSYKGWGFFAVWVFLQLLRAHFAFTILPLLLHKTVTFPKKGSFNTEIAFFFCSCSNFFSASIKLVTWRLGKFYERRVFRQKHIVKFTFHEEESIYEKPRNTSYKEDMSKVQSADRLQTCQKLEVYVSV